MNKYCPSLLICCALMSALPAFAAPDDHVRLSASYNLTYDNNIFRLPSENVAQGYFGSSQMSDIINRVEAGMDVDVPYSRQHFVGKASISKTQFGHFTYLDYDGREVLAKWNWQAGNQWSGDAGYSNARTLSSYAQSQSVERNVRTEERMFTDADYQLHPCWRLHFGASRYGVNYDASAQQISNFTQESAEAGVTYVSRASSTIGLLLRESNGNYPNQQTVGASLVDNSFKQSDLSGVWSWLYSGNTGFNGNFGYTRRDQSQLPARNFSGITGRASVNWQTGGSSALSVSVWRDLNAYQDLVSSYLVSKGIAVSVASAPTAKIGVQLGARYESDSYEGDPGLIMGLPLRNDKVSGANMGINYNPAPNVQFSISYQAERRSSNYALREYTDNTLFGMARVEFGIHPNTFH